MSIRLSTNALHIKDGESYDTIDVLRGAKGETGTTPDLTIGTVTTGAPGTSASATITGTDEDPVLNLTIPRGDTGTVNVDSELSTTSTNPVQNKVITNVTTQLSEDITQKITKPQTEGTQGQVLTSDGQGGQSWQTPSGGGESGIKAEYSGNRLKVTSDGTQDVNAKIYSGGDSVNVWQYDKNMLPLLSEFSAVGLTVTVEDDGTLVFNGTTTATSKATNITLNNVPVENPENNFDRYFLSWELSNAAPNSSGYIIFKVIDDRNRNAMTIGMNSATALTGGIFAAYTDSLYYATYQIQFYNVPVGTVFDNWRVKIKVGFGQEFGAYAEPSLSYKTIPIVNGSADLGIHLVDGENNIITDADSIDFTAEINILPDNYLGKRWACFGDSLTQKDTNALNNGEKRYYDIVSKQLGLSVLSYGRATTGYSTTGSVSQGQYYLRMQKVNPDLFDFMTIMGSTNDIAPMAQGTIQLGNYDDTGTTTVCGCINTTLDYYFSRAPLKPIGMISMLPTYAYGTDLLATTVAENYVNAQKQICASRGIPFLDLYHGSGMRPWDATVKSALYLNGDGIHPNNEGIKWFAPMIREFVKTLM